MMILGVFMLYTRGHTFQILGNRAELFRVNNYCLFILETYSLLFSLHINKFLLLLISLCQKLNLLRCPTTTRLKLPSGKQPIS